MNVIIKKGTHTLVVTAFVWRGPVEYLNGQNRFVFYANEQMGMCYVDACELARILPGFFVFDFYTEDGVRKVMFYPKDFVEIIFT